MTRSHLTFRRPLMIAFVSLVLAGLTSCAPRALPVDSVSKTNSITVRLAADGALFLDGEALRRQDLAKGLSRIADRLRVDARLSGEPVASDRKLSACILFQMDAKTPFSTVYQMATEAESVGFGQWAFLVDSGTNEPIRTRPGGTGPAPISLTSQGDLPDVLRTIPIRLQSSDQRNAVRIGIAERELSDFQALRAELASILSGPNNPFDRVTLTVDGEVEFADLVRAVNIIAGLKITKIAFQLEAAAPTNPK